MILADGDPQTPLIPDIMSLTIAIPPGFFLFCFSTAVSSVHEGSIHRVDRILLPAHERGQMLWNLLADYIAVTYSFGDGSFS